MSQSRRASVLQVVSSKSQSNLRGLFREGIEDEVLLTERWKKLSYDLTIPYQRNKAMDLRGMIKPYDNSSYVWVDLSLDLENRQVIHQDDKKVLIHYRIWKSERKFNSSIVEKAIFLLHGVGASSLSWRHSIQTLLDTYDLVVAIDLPGFGFSSREIGISHSRWNRAFWILQLMRKILLVQEFTDQISCTVMSHSMSCLFAPVIPWLVNQNDDGWKSFTNQYLLKDSKRFFKVDLLVLVAGSYFQSNLPDLLSFWPVQSFMKGFLKMVLGKNSTNTMLKKVFNRNPTNNELIGYCIPLEVNNSKDCLVDMLSSLKTDDQLYTKEYLDILNQLLTHTNVIQIVAGLDAVNTKEESEKLRNIFTNFPHTENGKKFFRECQPLYIRNRKRRIQRIPLTNIVITVRSGI